MNRLRLRIGPVIENAEEVRKRVERELPDHTGLICLATGVATAARVAEEAAKRLRRPFGFHRLPAAFLILALLVLFIWIWLQFFDTRKQTIAIPERDFEELKKRVDGDGNFKEIERRPDNSWDALKIVTEGKADLGVVQGGVDIPIDILRLETPYRELVLWFVRSSLPETEAPRRILTSKEGADSHTVAKVFMKAWKLDAKIEYVHEWNKLIEDKEFVIPVDIDAVFVVKDPSDEHALVACERLSRQGFRLASPDLGARSDNLDYLRPYVISTGYLQTSPPIPTSPVQTYTVSTYLIASTRMTPRMRANASHLMERRASSLTDERYEPSLGETGNLLQGIEAFLGIIFNLVLAFLALTGLEMMAYRKRFHELNSLVSLISIHQSSKDVLGLRDALVLRENLLYLTLCSDLLGLVSMIGGYYTQENSSLLFSGMPEIIHQRCDGLKINIQLKILHATITAEQLGTVETSGGDRETGSGGNTEFGIG